MRDFWKALKTVKGQVIPLVIITVISILFVPGRLPAVLTLLSAVVVIVEPEMRKLREAKAARAGHLSGYAGARGGRVTGTLLREYGTAAADDGIHTAAAAKRDDRAKRTKRTGPGRILWYVLLTVAILYGILILVTAWVLSIP